SVSRINCSAKFEATMATVLVTWTYIILGNFVEDFKNEIEKGFLKQFDRTCSIYEINIAKGTHLINTKDE
ncbi:MAG: hypothetical protein VXY88_04280, partial [Bacteroidota bacterium]|nr:hypothetical protein [Bacteroidota bacterium]